MNGWTRLGIVASVIWMIGVGGYGHIQIEQRERQDRETAYSVHGEACYRDKAQKPADPATVARQCEREAFDEYNAPWRAQDRWRAWASAGLNLIAIWILVLVTILVVRWIRAGFRPKGEGA